MHRLPLSAVSPSPRVAARVAEASPPAYPGPISLRQSFGVANRSPKYSGIVDYLALTCFESHRDATLSAQPPNATHELVSGHPNRTDVYCATRVQADNARPLFSRRGRACIPQPHAWASCPFQFPRAGVSHAGHRNRSTNPVLCSREWPTRRHSLPSYSAAAGCRLISRYATRSATTCWTCFAYLENGRGAPRDAVKTGQSVQRQDRPDALV